MMAENGSATKFSTCVFCDGGCGMRVQGEGDDAKLAPADEKVPAICSKAVRHAEYALHADRVVHPLKNVGTRTDPRWEQVSWDQALDEIAERLQGVIDRYGAEAVAFAETPLNTGFGGITRRFMNHLGSPNYIVPTLLCMGNTAQVHRAVYGWIAACDWGKTDLVVYFGQNRGPELWPKEYYALKAALDRGAKLVCVDPRQTETTALADEHLRIRYGTDAALVLAWINVIVAEGLYDRTFVETQTTGFDELAAHVAPCTPEWAAEVCEISADDIRRTARMIGKAHGLIIPWGVVADMQANSTALLHGQCILRAICGALNVTEHVSGPGTGARTNSQVADFGAIAPGQLEKQIGADAYPLMSFRAMRLYADAYARAGIDHVPDIMGASCTAHPNTLFRAMATGDPYPVKAVFCIGNNTVMSYAGQRDIVEGFLNQDLVVTFDHWLTPTAQLSDYVLPGDAWMERDTVGPAYDRMPITTISRRFTHAPGECKDWYFVVKGLADRLGLEDAFPWASSHDYFDWRLAPAGKTWSEAKDTPVHPAASMQGTFLTPSGKVELKSSVLEALGCDPLPVYREHVEPGIDEAEYPFVVYSGTREKASYNSNLHQIGFLRKREPEPLAFVNPADADTLGIAEGGWTRVTSTYGEVELVAHLDEAQPAGTVRVPHGWWKPETPQGYANGLSGAMLHNDGMLFSGERWNLDPAQGLPNLRGGIRVKLAPMGRTI